MTGSQFICVFALLLQGVVEAEAPCEVHICSEVPTSVVGLKLAGLKGS